MDEITPEQMVDAALNPQKMVNADQEVEERPISELIELDKHLKGKQAAASKPGNPFAGLKFGIVSPPGTRGRQ
jgi:hypothetical protein